MDSSFSAVTNNTMAGETSTGYVPVPMVDPQNDDACAPPPPKQVRPSHEQPPRDQYHPVVAAPPSSELMI